MKGNDWHGPQRLEDLGYSGLCWVAKVPEGLYCIRLPPLDGGGGGGPLVGRLLWVGRLLLVGRLPAVGRLLIAWALFLAGGATLAGGGGGGRPLPLALLFFGEELVPCGGVF